MQGLVSLEEERIPLTKAQKWDQLHSLQDRLRGVEIWGKSDDHGSLEQAAGATLMFTGAYKDVDRPDVKARCIKYHVGIPDWVDAAWQKWNKQGFVRNLRGIGTTNSKQLVATVLLGDCVIDAVLDTGAVRTIVDKHTAECLALENTVYDRKAFGRFHGPGGAAGSYVGKIEGPVRIHFGEEAYLDAPNIHVTEESANSLLLIGADVLEVRRRGDWSYHSVGGDEDGRGFIVLKQPGKDRRVKISLLNCPEQGRKFHLTIPRALREADLPKNHPDAVPPILKTKTGSRRVSWASENAWKTDNPQAGEVVAAVQDQDGQCL